MKYNNRIKTDPIFKLKRTCKTRIAQSIKKDKKTDKYVGCKMSFLKEWIEFCFTNNMNFQNHGEIWHVDHVIPIDTFDLTKDHNQFACFDWKNLSPELATYNLSKNNSIHKDQVMKHIQNLINFHKLKNMEIPYTYIATMLLKI